MCRKRPSIEDLLLKPCCLEKIHLYFPKFIPSLFPTLPLSFVLLQGSPGSPWNPGNPNSIRIWEILGIPITRRFHKCHKCQRSQRSQRSQTSPHNQKKPQDRPTLLPWCWDRRAQMTAFLPIPNLGELACQPRWFM